MWQRFTQSARKTVFYAQEDARRFGEGYVSTEHLLLGLVREPDEVVSQVLRELGIGPQRIRKEVERQLPRSDGRPSQDMTLTPRAKRVIDLAFDEAKAFKHKHIGCEHLLLGLIREGDGLAGRVLEKLGADLHVARQTVARAHGQTPPTMPETLVRPSPGRASTFAGSCIQEHLFLALIADDGPAAKIIAAQVKDIGELQWNVLREIEHYAAVGAKRAYPEVLTRTLELAHEEANGTPPTGVHFLLALLNEEWISMRFSAILRHAGLTRDRTRELVAGG